MNVTKEQAEHALAIVALAVPTVIAVLHAVIGVVRRLRAYAITTPETWDERALDRVLRVLDWIEVLVYAVAKVIPSAPRETVTTPSLERAEADERDPTGGAR